MIRVGRKLIIIVSASAFIAAAAIAVLFGINVAGKTGFDRTGIENALETKDVSTAEFEISMAAKKIRDEQSWYQLLGYAFEHATITGDYTLFTDVARQAVKKQRRQQDFKACLVYGLIRSGSMDTKRVEKLMNKIGAPRYRPLSLFAAVQGFREGTDTLGYLLANPETTDPYLYERLARQVGRSEISLNSALLWMGQGNVEKVREILRGSLDYTKRPETLLDLAMDTGDYELALNIIGFLRLENRMNSTDLDMLEADIALKQYELEHALDIYESIIERESTYSWIPYLNASWIMHVTGRIEPALIILTEALERFPDEKHVALTASAVNLEQGNRIESQAILSSYLSRHPDDIDARLLEITMAEGLIDVSRIKTSLWTLFAEERDNSRIVRYLSSFLAIHREFDDISDLRSRFSGGEEDAEWMSFIEGYQSVYEDDLEKSIQSFQKSLLHRARWETHYNLGRIFAGTNRKDLALEHFQKAGMLLDMNASESNNQTRSDVRYRIAESFFLQGNMQGAAREAGFALKLDPGNVKASLLLKKLEAENKR